MSFVSASQMWELVNVFPFIIGSEVYEDDPHYACFMLLDDLAKILFSPVIAVDQIPLFE